MTGDGAKPRASAWTGVFRVKAHPGGEPWPYGPSWRERFSFLEGREQALDSLAYHMDFRYAGLETAPVASYWSSRKDRVVFAYDALWFEESTRIAR